MEIKINKLFDNKISVKKKVEEYTVTNKEGASRGHYLIRVHKKYEKGKWEVFQVRIDDLNSTAMMFVKKVDWALLQKIIKTWK